jgi:membrane-bound lytic murein transglycosylase F
MKDRYLMIGIFFMLLFACDRNVKHHNTAGYTPYARQIISEPLFYQASYKEEFLPRKVDLEQIRKRGKLVALTGYSYTGYFIYKGTPMGYEYELLQMLAKHLDVKLEIVLVKNFDDMFDMLENGEGDIIAHNLTVNKIREEKVAFTIHHNTTRQVLVQKKPANHKKMRHDQLEKALVRDPLDLLGKEVYVRMNSPHHLRLLNLNDEIGGDIKIVEMPADVEVEDLILQVAEGKIPFTIADENIALVNQSYYPELDVGTPVSFQQRLAWAMRKDSPDLLKEVNQWILEMKKDPVYNVIYNKYYKSKKGVDSKVKCSRDMTCGKMISPYDSLIIEHATAIGWDWRLLASLIYQESRFSPVAKSWAGASGLMQLMPATAREFGTENTEDPVENIAAGCRYLKWLENYWKDKIADEDERMKFVMGSYNVGLGHVADAVRLAKKYQKQADKWDDNVAHFLLMKSKPQYHSDPVVRYGYCRGIEPFKYVNEILDRYSHYKTLIDEKV